MTKRQDTMFTAGYVLGGALGLVRFVAATTIGDIVLAVALTLADFGIIRIVENKVRALMVQDAEIEASNAKIRQLQSQVGAASAEAEQRQSLADRAAVDLLKTETEIAFHHAVSDGKALCAIAVNAIKAGHHAGTSANYGENSGVRAAKVIA